MVAYYITLSILGNSIYDTDIWSRFAGLLV